MRALTFYVRQFSLALLVVLLLAFAATTQTTTFTHQGKLPDDYNQPTGAYDLQFNLYDEATGSNLPLNATPIALEDIQATVKVGYFAPNPAQGWRARFDSDGLSVETRTGGGETHRWAMRLRSSGYGERVVPVERAEVAAKGSRVEYRRGSLVEWYVNEQRGVEQGFTIGAPPAVAGARAQGEQLSLRLAVEGDLRAELSADGQNVGFVNAAGERELLYDQLVAFDARGRELPSRMRVEGAEVVLEVEDAGASYPLTIDPLIQQQKLTASDAAAGDNFGHTVSFDGDTAIVGAWREDNSGGVDAGAAYVFTRSGVVWTQQQKLTAADAAADDGFGFSVSVSGDTALIGSIMANNSSGQNAGAAYVFTRSDGVWTQQQRLQASDVALNDLFGYSVSLSGDTAVVTSVGDDDGGQQAGSAYIFTRSNGVWTQQQKIQASDRKEGANFGHSASLDGDTVIISAWQDDNGIRNAAGAAYVFTRSGGVWTQQQKLIASDASTLDFFGTSVALSDDTAIVGAPHNAAVGAAYVFTRSAGVWTQQQQLRSSDFAGDDYFGGRVAVSGDTAVVSSLLDDNGGGTDAGSAYVFIRSGGVWTEQQKFMASDAAANDSFGISIGLSGGTVIVGAYQDDIGGGAAAGSAYVFVPEVANAAPVVDAGPDQSASEDAALNLTASFTDAAASDTHTANINWGDGSPAEAATVIEPSGPNPGTVTASHTYLAPSNYTVTVTVTDSVNASGSDTLQVAVGPALSASYIQNTTTQQANANFNISGNGVVGGNLSVNGALNASGSGLTDLNAARITTGTLDNARLGVIPTANIADSAITTPKIADSAVTAAKIGSNQVVKTLNGLTDGVNLAAGANVTITPSGNTLTISAASGSFIQNTTTQQPGSNFNISGDGTAANLTASSVLSGNVVNATTQFNLGGQRVLSTAGTNNIFVGNSTGISNALGHSNSYVGTGAGQSNTTGYHNAFFGYIAGTHNTSGVQNVFLGANAGITNTTGSSNAFVGYGAGYSNTLANANTFFGTFAGYNNTTGVNNTFVGVNAGLYNTTGYFNLFDGLEAGKSNTEGYFNSFVGPNSGYGNTTGYYNSFFGFQAGYTNTTGNNNTIIGTYADMSSNNLSFATAIGAYATVATSNTIALGRANGSDKVRIFGLGAAGSTQLCRNANNEVSTCSSSLRYKTNVAPFSSGLGLLQRLRPIRFEWKDSGMKDVGFGAEDVAAVEPLLITYDDKGRAEGVKYDRISAVLVNAVKEQQAQIEAQQTQLKQQQAQLESQQQQFTQQQTLIDGLRKLLCRQNPTAEVCR